MSKTAEVVSNDPKEPVVQLMVAGSVDKFATITPRMVSLRGAVGETLKQSVTIVPEDKYPFKILEAQARDGKNIRVALNEVTEAGKPSYALVVENLQSAAGSYNDSVVLKTDSKLQPELEVRVFIYLRPAPAGEKKKS